MWHKRALSSLLPPFVAAAAVTLLLGSAVAMQDPSGRPEGANLKRKKPTKERAKPATEPITVILTVMTDPPESDVYVNGEKRGSTNAEGKIQFAKLPLGHYRIEVRKDGFTPALRSFDAGAESPTLVFRLAPELDAVVKQFNSLIDSGRLTGPESPNAFEVLNSVSSRFSSRPEVARMRASLGEKLKERIAPVIPRTVARWREVTRDELMRAREAATNLAIVFGDDRRAQAQAAYLNAIIAFRDWQAGVNSTAQGEPKSEGGTGGQAEEGAGGLNGTRAELEKALRFDESLAPAWLRLGGVLLLTGEAGAAEAAFVKSSILEPKWAAAQSGLGSAYYAGGKYKEAVAAYQKAIELDGRSSEAYAGLGLAKAARGDIGAGVKDVQHATDLDPTSALAHLNLGIIFSMSKKAKDLARAEEELKKAVQMNAQNLEFQDRVANQLIADLENRKKKRK